MVTNLMLRRGSFGKRKKKKKKKTTRDIDFAPLKARWRERFLLTPAEAL